MATDLEKLMAQMPNNLGNPIPMPTRPATDPRSIDPGMTAAQDNFDRMQQVDQMMGGGLQDPRMQIDPSILPQVQPRVQPQTPEFDQNLIATESPSIVPQFPTDVGQVANISTGSTLPPLSGEVDFMNFGLPTGGKITRGDETFTTQGFGQQVGDISGMAPAGQSSPSIVADRQDFEQSNAARVAGLTPEQRAKELAMSDAAVNRRQIQQEESQGLFRPSEYQIGQAKTEAVARQADYEQRQANNRINDQMKQFKWDNPNATVEDMQKQQLILTNQEKAIEPQTPDSGQAFEQGMAERKQSLAERKYNDTVAKEAAGVPLSPSDQLAREKWEAEKSAGQRQTATEEKITTIKKANPSISDEDASAIASGSVRVVQNPLTGETQLLNLTTGEASKVGAEQRPEVNFDVAQPDQTLFSRAGEFTGAIEAGKRKAQGLTGQFGLDVASDESLGAAQDFETAGNEIIRAFRESDRYSATEAKELKKELNIALSPFEDPKSAEAKLRSIDKSLARRYENEVATFQDTSFPPADRQDARLRAKAIAEFRATLGVPEGEEAPEQSADVPQGIDPKDWEFMDDAQRNLFK